MSKRLALTIGLCVAGCGLSACTHYRVTDPTSERVYYTKKIDHKRSGAVTFEDEASGREISIQNSEVEKVSGKEFKSGVAEAKAGSEE